MITSPDSLITTCVIGGTGFIGRAVVNALLAQRRHVIVIGRKHLNNPLPTGVEYVQVAVNSRDELLKKVLERSQEVIDLAYGTTPQTSFTNPVNDILSNLPETVSLFELAASFPIRKFVYVSSGGTVYGRTLADSISEEHPTNPLSPYGITKLAIEKYTYMYFKNYALPIFCVRPSNAFGPGQQAFVGQGFIATAIASILRGDTIKIFGKEGTVRDYLHVADMADGIVAALVDGVPGEVYNIGSGRGLTNRQVLNTIMPLAAQIGRRVEIEELAHRPFDVPANVLNSNKLQHLSGWQPTMSFETALEQTWNWYVKNSAD